MSIQDAIATDGYTCSIDSIAVGGYICKDQPHSGNHGLEYVTIPKKRRKIDFDVLYNDPCEEELILMMAHAVLEEFYH